MLMGVRDVSHEVDQSTRRKWLLLRIPTKLKEASMQRPKKPFVLVEEKMVIFSAACMVSLALVSGPIAAESCDDGCSVGDRVDGCSFPDIIQEVGQCWMDLFESACNLHDRCYSTPEEDKQYCDDIFNDYMNEICQDLDTATDCGGTCLAAAELVYEAMDSDEAQDAYDSGQKWAEECCENDTWSSHISEPDSKYTCDQDFVMIGRYHHGDENGYTQYHCRQYEGYKFSSYDELSWNGASEESSSDYKCPDLKVMVGRKHNGDENGDTKYKCVSVPDGTELEDEEKSDGIKESDYDSSEFDCPDFKVMTGRKHSGDENGDTHYYCSSMEQEFVSGAEGES